ncbi:Putative nuclease HARBI1 [Eumeta japonica]|uniref:Nuclease HARBI1 n=1 Tax=Eumeta variegata TaxID=151549 RepID=A0A4C2A9Q2_EUMVA|nr:Putative nuclease HARBI1 [Eumeta japonica]
MWVAARATGTAARGCARARSAAPGQETSGGNPDPVSRLPGPFCVLYIFFASGSYQRALATGHCVSQQALSDSGYALKPWLLLTPITGAPPGSREYRYTKVHAKTRNRIERCIGLLKSRWRCLLKHKTLHYNPDIAQKIIIACCILHNMAIEHNIPPIELSEEDFRDEEVVVQDVNEEIDLRGLAVLNNLITTHFQ